MITVLMGLQAALAKYEPKKLLAAPLITGASVSADWKSLSPGKRLALKYTDSEKIRTRAVGGRAGVETIKTLNDADFTGRSIVLALDFLFWDSTLESISGSLLALDQLIEIPALLPPGRQPQREKLNKAIHANCVASENCYVMAFDKLHRQIRRDGYLVIKNRRFTLRELIPDGLHLSEVAGQELMDRLEALISH
ncbi:MAG: hypothetical protein M3461_15395 [Pseudomonadota bacterium]|nr:hypothetical protein [Pseudomonadota bacterium]